MQQRVGRGTAARQKRRRSALVQRQNWGCCLRRHRWAPVMVMLCWSWEQGRKEGGVATQMSSSPTVRQASRQPTGWLLKRCLPVGCLSCCVVWWVGCHGCGRKEGSNTNKTNNTPAVWAGWSGVAVRQVPRRQLANTFSLKLEGHLWVRKFDQCELQARERGAAGSFGTCVTCADEWRSCYV